MTGAQGLIDAMRREKRVLSGIPKKKGATVNDGLDNKVSISPPPPRMIKHAQNNGHHVMDEAGDSATS